MADADDENNDAVLSDVDDEDPVPIAINSSSISSGDSSLEQKLREALTELDRERQAREKSEASKSELQVSFNRLKVLIHDAIRKRDESSRQKDEALREKEELSKSNEKLLSELSEASRMKDVVLNQKDEIEKASQMLISGTEKISRKVSNFRNFAEGGLPKSQKYTGLAAVAYGVIKRSNEIVEELVKQIELASKSRDEARQQIEQRNYEIAIEVSQLEATISGLRENESNLEKSIAEKDDKISEMIEKQNLWENESLEMKQMIKEYEEKLRNLESRMEVQKPLLVDQLSYVAKIHDRLYSVIKMVDASKLDQSELSESLFFAQETDMEENMRASLAGMEFIYELSGVVVEKTRDLVDETSREVKRLNETVSQLVKEKEHIGSLLRSALSRRTSADLSSKTNELFKVAEDGLKEAGIDYRFSNHVGDRKVLDSNDKEGTLETEDEIYTLAGALENIIKQSQLEIIELQHTVEELRAETSLLKQHVESQAKELIQRKQRMEELEEKERVANENVEGLMMDTAAAEEEITRWKVAAQEEAAAGKAIEQEFLEQLSSLRQELEEAKQAVIESEKKLKFKEETAGAAMAARDAAERSLRLADSRASRLRDKVEELTHQLEELDTQEASATGQSRPRYVCWPWQWLGLNFVGSHQQSSMQLEGSNEMELSEPFI